MPAPTNNRDFASAATPGSAADRGAVATLVDMLQRVSGSRTAHDAFAAFMERLHYVRPVEHLLGIAPDASGDRRYRVLYRVASEDLRRGGTVPRRNVAPTALDEMPVFEGGVIGRLIEEGQPAVVASVDTRDDPALGSLEGPLACMALPIYAGSAIAEWVFSLSRRGDAPTPEEMHNALLIANLMNVAQAQLASMEEARRLNDELGAQFEEVARIQQMLLPRRIPDIPGLDLATSYLTSDRSGGDYYDYFRLPGGCWGILVADVSGHGAGAATVMAMLHAILHGHAGENRAEALDPEATLRYANTRLSQSGIEGNFVTAFLGVYDPARSVLRFASAGHPPPRLRRGSDGRVVALEDAAGIPLGVLNVFTAQVNEISLGPSDTLLLYTDGITEVFDASREMFGTERLDAALASCDGPPDCVIESVHSALYAHCGVRTRADDQTLVVLRRTGAGVARRP